MASLGPALEKRPHPTKGHALYALRPFPSGSPIQAFTPTILLPQTSHLEVLCAHCLRQPPDGTAPRACTRCRAAFYCSANCQTLHWRAVHAKECKPLAKLREREGEGRLLPTLVRAALQAAVKEEIGKGLEGMEGHTERWLSSEKWEGRGMRVAAAALVMYSGRKDLTMDMAARILTQVESGARESYKASRANECDHRSRQMHSTDMTPTWDSLASFSSRTLQWRTIRAFPMPLCNLLAGTRF